MLYCAYTKVETGHTDETAVYVGTKLNILAKDVNFVQADGHELEFIMSEIHGIPTHGGPVIRWYGDHARFIAAAWNQLT